MDSRRIRDWSVAAVAGALLASGVVHAGGLGSSGEAVCKTRAGYLRITATGECRRGEFQVELPQGPQGFEGPVGPQGEPGPQGAPGPQGESGSFLVLKDAEGNVFHDVVSVLLDQQTDEFRFARRIGRKNWWFDSNGVLQLRNLAQVSPSQIFYLESDCSGTPFIETVTIRTSSQVDWTPGYSSTFGLNTANFPFKFNYFEWASSSPSDFPGPRPMTFHRISLNGRWPCVPSNYAGFEGYPTWPLHPLKEADLPDDLTGPISLVPLS